MFNLILVPDYLALLQVLWLHLPAGCALQPLFVRAHEPPLIADNANVRVVVVAYWPVDRTQADLVQVEENLL